ncbi:MAG: polymerase subunit delta [Verrucomicrobiota bacterium]|jgi:DNA polymerase-3 subunit delta
MPAKKKQTGGEAPVVLVFGEESVLVRARARALFDQWSEELGGMDHERLDASAANTGEALRALGRLREALQTLPFFGSGKVVWFEGCSFLGDERTALAKPVGEALGELAVELGNFRWEGVRLIISAGKVDKRRVFYKALAKLGSVEEQEGLSASMRDWEGRAESLVHRRAGEAGKRFVPEAVAVLVASVGPNLGQLFSEVDKVATYVGEREQVTAKDVREVAIHNKQARAFALGDALGERDLAGLLRALDEELWEARGGGSGGEIGLLYGLISKVRAMLLAKEMVGEGWIKSLGDYYRFKSEFEALPEGRFASDRRYNPRLMNAFVVFRAAQQARNYSREELVWSLERLMECGRSLMSSSLDESVVLQQALVEICDRSPKGLRL